jgi:hypothetical protein
LGLSPQYKENNSEVGKWLKRWFGLHFLKPFDVEDSFTEDIMPGCPDPRCEKFADYLVENYVTVGTEPVSNNFDEVISGNLICLKFSILFHEKTYFILFYSTYKCLIIHTSHFDISCSLDLSQYISEWKISGK